jgi:predicted ATPase
MKVNRLVCENLYGFINKTVDFKENINLLVGINGSGKTSILNILHWLTKPSLPDLAVTEFSQLILDFTFKNENYQLKATQDEVEVKLFLNNLTKNFAFEPIQATFHIHPSKISRNERLKSEFREKYLALGPEKHEVKTWRFLFDTLPMPIVIGLDRFLQEKNESERKRNPLGTPEKKDPIDNVKSIANREYSLYQSKMLTLNSSLNEKIMMAPFNNVYKQDQLNELMGQPIIAKKQLSDLEFKITKYFEDSVFSNRDRSQKEDDSIKLIKSYFKELKAIMTDDIKDRVPLVYIMNISQIMNIKMLMREFETFEKRSKVYYSKIEAYLTTLNGFFRDSSKEIIFKKDIGELKFNILDKNGKVIEENRDIETLSSGEKQILMLFTYLSFNTQGGILFIIDEPELSLHPKWQEDFLPNVEKLMPKNAQLLIATHSPIIVGKKKEYCTVLLPYNN